MQRTQPDAAMLSQVASGLLRRLAGRLYHHWYYSAYVWRETTFLGVSTLKSVSDMWNYQEIICELGSPLVVEFGTRFGGSALYFQSLLREIRPRHKVLTVDVDDKNISPLARRNPNIEIMVASSADPRVANRVRELREEYPGAAFVILDSDHSKEHVLAEMNLLRGVTRQGDYVVVEDSNINGHPVRWNFGPGPYEAIQAYEAEHPNDYRHDTARESKFAFTFAVNGFLVRN